MRRTSTTSTWTIQPSSELSSPVTPSTALPVNSRSSPAALAATWLGRAAGRASARGALCLRGDAFLVELLLFLVVVPLPSFPSLLLFLAAALPVLDFLVPDDRDVLAAITAPFRDGLVRPTVARRARPPTSLLQHRSEFPRCAGARPPPAAGGSPRGHRRPPRPGDVPAPRRRRHRGAVPPVGQGCLSRGPSAGPRKVVRCHRADETQANALVHQFSQLLQAAFELDDPFVLDQHGQLKQVIHASTLPPCLVKGKRTDRLQDG